LFHSNDLNNGTALVADCCALNFNASLSMTLWIIAISCCTSQSMPCSGSSSSSSSTGFVSSVPSDRYNTLDKSTVVQQTMNIDHRQLLHDVGPTEVLVHMVV